MLIEYEMNILFVLEFSHLMAIFDHDDDDTISSWMGIVADLNG